MGWIASDTIFGNQFAWLRPCLFLDISLMKRDVEMMLFILFYLVVHNFKSTLVSWLIRNRRYGWMWLLPYRLCIWSRSLVIQSYLLVIGGIHKHLVVMCLHTLLLVLNSLIVMLLRVTSRATHVVLIRLMWPLCRLFGGVVCTLSVLLLCTRLNRLLACVHVWC